MTDAPHPALIASTTAMAVWLSGCALVVGARLSDFAPTRRRLWTSLAAAGLGAGLLGLHHLGSRAAGVVSALDGSPLLVAAAWLLALAVAAIVVVMIERSALRLTPGATIGVALVTGVGLAALQHGGIVRSDAMPVLAGADSGLAAAALGAALSLAATLGLLVDRRWLEHCRRCDREREAAERSHRLAYYDEATGLPNRSLFTERLLRRLVDADHRDPESFGLVYAELRDYRLLMQRFGEAAMSERLRGIVQRLGSELRDGDVLARLSADGLMLMVREHDDRDLAIAVNRVAAQLSTPLMAGDDSFRFSWALGHSRYPDDGESTQALIRAATRIQRQIGSEAPALACSSRPRFANAS